MCQSKLNVFSPGCFSSNVNPRHCDPRFMALIFVVVWNFFVALLFGARASSDPCPNPLLWGGGVGGGFRPSPWSGARLRPRFPPARGPTPCPYPRAPLSPRPAPLSAHDQRASFVVGSGRREGVPPDPSWGEGGWVAVRWSDYPPA